MSDAEGARWPGASTRPVVLLGDPVAHSLSPRLHNTVFRRHGLDLVYLALPTPAASVPTVLAALGAVGAVGANVTVPHKLLVHDECDELSPEATALGAVNTLVWRAGRLHGTNTDASGLGRVLAATVPDLDGAEAVVLGTGGAARAAVVALVRAGAVTTVVGRSASSLDEVVAVGRRAGDAVGRRAGDAVGRRAGDAVGRRAGDAVGSLPDGGVRRLLLGEEDVVVAVERAAVVVNATPLGMSGERLPDPFHRLRPDQVAHDLVYGRQRTPFLVDADAAGAPAHDGRAMLAAQAHDSFVVWTGREPTAGAYEAALPS